MITRRTFSKGLAMLAGTPSLGGKALAGTLFSGPAEAASYAYVGSSPATGKGAIHVFRTTRRQWYPVQVVVSAAPVHLEPHPSLPVLYAAHAIALSDNLPRGAVSAYSVDPLTGQLRLLNMQPLSLSATSPRHAVVTRDGARLVVTSQEGGSYNLLPIARDGSLQAPESCRKELGLIDDRATKIAQPRQVICHPDGSTLLAADAGNEAIHSFAVENGLITLQHRRRVHAGNGPSQIALSPNGRWIYALNAGNGSISVHHWDQNSRQISPSFQIVAAPQTGLTSMAMHPTGRFLVMAGADEEALALALWRIDQSGGCLTFVGAAQQSESCDGMAFSPGGEHLICISTRSGRIVRTSFDIEIGAIGNRKSVARVQGTSCITLHSI
jgi:6-phosphogluconolactonase